MPRIHVLDSVRGLAALSVLFHHTLTALPTFMAADLHLQGDGGRLVNLSAFSPVHLAWAGYEAVILFFVLSGFVLALPFFESEWPDFPGFLVKRIFRIYVPYILVIAGAAMFATALQGQAGPAWSAWVNGEWSEPLTNSDALNLALMRVDVTGKVDGAAWSLFHEMRISLVFPILVIAVRRLAPAATALLATALYIGGYALSSSAFFFNHQLDMTVHYAGIFVLGILVARYRAALCGRLRRLSAPALGCFGVLLMLAYLWQWLAIPAFGLLRPRLIADPFVDLLAALAASGAIVAVLSFGKLQRALSWPALLWLGKISYSLYLVHVVVLLAVARMSATLLPPAVALGLALILSLAAAAIVHTCIENPSRLLGQRLAANVSVARARLASSIGEWASGAA